MPPLPVARCHSKLMAQVAQSRSQDHLDCWLSASPDFLWAAAGSGDRHRSRRSREAGEADFLARARNRPPLPPRGIGGYGAGSLEFYLTGTGFPGWSTATYTTSACLT